MVMVEVQKEVAHLGEHEAPAGLTAVVGGAQDVELEVKQLLVLKPAGGLGDRRGIRRGVNFVQCLGERHQPVLREQRGRKGFGYRGISQLQESVGHEACHGT